MAESIDIFLPIDQFGCFSAFLGEIFINNFNGYFLKGPPEAVKYTFSKLLFFYL